MIVAARGGFNHHISRGDSGSSYLSPYGYGGHGYGATDAIDANPIGLTAVAAAIRLLAGTISTFVMRPYTGDASKRQPVFDAWQAPLLQDAAPGYCTGSDLWSDVVTSIESWGTALIWKGRDGDGIIRELYPFPAESSWVYVDANGNRVVEARVNGEKIDITRNVIVVRGWTPIPAVEGQSTTRLHRRTLNGAVALEEFRGRYFDADSTPNLVLLHPGKMTPEQVVQQRDSWKARHGGPDGEKTAVLWGGMDVKQLTSTLAEAQLATLANQDVMSIARAWRIYPSSLLHVSEERTLPTTENVATHFYTFSLMERLTTIQRAVSADRELFPDRAVYGQFDTSRFLSADAATMATMIHQLVQAGVLTQNEGRARIGEPPSDDPKADELQQTPVGGAVNDTTTAPSNGGQNG